MHCSVPVMLCNATNFIRKLPSLVINIGIFLCQHMRQMLETIVFSRGYICRNQSITLSKFHCRYYEAHLIFSFFFHCFWYWCYFFIDYSVSFLMLSYKSLWEIFCIFASLPLCEANALDF